jgi:hypothetical protein
MQKELPGTRVYRHTRWVVTCGTRVREVAVVSTVDRNTSMWQWRERDTWTADRGTLDGFAVEASDGSIGKIDESTYDAGSSYVVVDTGPWIFGKKVMLPAGVIDRVDYDGERVFVALAKEQIKNAPEFDDSTYRDETYRSRVGSYYGGMF